MPSVITLTTKSAPIDLLF